MRRTKESVSQRKRKEVRDALRRGRNAPKTGGAPKRKKQPAPVSARRRNSPRAPWDVHPTLLKLIIAVGKRCVVLEGFVQPYAAWEAAVKAASAFLIPVSRPDASAHAPRHLPGAGGATASASAGPTLSRRSLGEGATSHLNRTCAICGCEYECLLQNRFRQKICRKPECRAELNRRAARAAYERLHPGAHRRPRLRLDSGSSSASDANPENNQRPATAKTPSPDGTSTPPPPASPSPSASSASLRETSPSLAEPQRPQRAERLATLRAADARARAALAEERGETADPSEASDLPEDFGALEPDA